MTGVTTSSSAVRSSATDALRTFDVSKESELLQLLNYIRRGPFEAGQKNQLRDAVLDYAVTHDTATLEEYAGALRVGEVLLMKEGAPLPGFSDESPETSSAVKEHESEKPPHGSAGNTPTVAAVSQSGQNHVATSTQSQMTSSSLGSSRPAPAFGASKPPVSPPVQPVPAPERAVKETIAAKESPESATPEDTKPPQPAPVADSTLTRIPVVSSLADTTAEDSKEKMAHTTADPSVATSVAPETPASVATDPLTRVKEIKRLVNEKVGNPVNLIDANNVIGREYMNALLNAMKQVNGGSSEEIELAMARLEKAFTDVHQSIASGETVIGESDPKAQEASDTSTTADDGKEVNADVEPAPLAEPSPGLQSSVTPAPAQPEVIQTAPPASAPEPAIDEPAPAKDSEVTPAPAPVVEEPEQSPAPSLATPPVPESAEPEASADALDTRVTSPAPQSLAAKLAAKQTERAERTAARAAELKVEEQKESADPLHSNAVSSGLQQLLSEWKLFKSSGLFGTGPSGFEHPLYKKLSALPMSTIIAARFEGATPEIKQSITDYINGWRYEQQIVHEMSETFEHYLRRVIKHILDNRPKQPTK